MHADGGGLYLQVTKTASGRINRSWIYRYAVAGRERQMGLGPLSEVKLSAAREKAAECRSNGWRKSIQSKRATTLDISQSQAA